MRILVQKLLRFFARKILHKYKPEVIGITGSVGKTSTKEAVYAVLAPHFRVRKNIGNYNNELGVPLVIIGKDSGEKNIFRWMEVFLHAVRLLLVRDKNYPEILVLEMAADRPGDIRYLIDFAPPDIGVLTRIGPVHLEFFGTVEKILAEKKLIVSKLPKEGFAVLNFDAKDILSIADEIRANVITYGFDEGADVRAVEMIPSSEEVSDETRHKSIAGVSFKLVFKGSTVPVHLPKVLGKTQVYAALIGATIGILKGLNLVRISENLKHYNPPPGRMRIIHGIKHTQILDDTYNASPLPTIAALEVMMGISIPEENKKYAVLGDMFELGKYTEEGHREVGLKAAETGVDVLVAVGERALGIVNAAREAGMPEDRVFHFHTTEEAGRFVQERLKKGDLVLVKGSRKMKMEQIVKELMSEPLRAGELLVQ